MSLTHLLVSFVAADIVCIFEIINSHSVSVFGDRVRDDSEFVCERFSDVRLLLSDSGRFCFDSLENQDNRNSTTTQCRLLAKIEPGMYHGLGLGGLLVHPSGLEGLIGPLPHV